MKEIIIQLITAFLGSLGFAMFFNVNKKHIIHGSVGGLLGWAVYIVCIRYNMSIFSASVITALLCSAYSEISARLFKAPAIIFYIPSIVPLIPGSSLYYTVSNAVSGDTGLFLRYGLNTVQYVFGIVVGITIVSTIIYLINKIKQEKQKNIIQE